MKHYTKFFFVILTFLCYSLSAVSMGKIPRIAPGLKKDKKMHVVVAMPFQPNIPLDPHWYTEEYVKYIENLLPSDKFTVSGYFVSLATIPQFIEDMKALYDKEKNVRVLNVCDGGEWDGYPGISVVRMWEKHPVSRLVPMTGADTEFIFNSDDKTKMNLFIRKAKLKSLPQILVTTQQFDKTDVSGLIAKEGLDKMWPLFCKLNIGAAALGIGPSSICHNIEELKIQLQKVHTEFPKSDIIVQPYLVGPEYTILVVNDEVYAGVQRDYHNHYNIMLEDYLLGVRPTEEEITFYPAPKRIQRLAVKAIQAIPGKHHYTRVDLRSDANGNTYVIDINDRPGIGNPSTVKCMVEFHQLTEAGLLLHLIESAGFVTSLK